MAQLRCFQQKCFFIFPCSLDKRARALFYIINKIAKTGTVFMVQGNTGNDFCTASIPAFPFYYVFLVQSRIHQAWNLDSCYSCCCCCWHGVQFDSEVSSLMCCWLCTVQIIRTNIISHTVKERLQIELHVFIERNNILIKLFTLNIFHFVFS